MLYPIIDPAVCRARGLDPQFVAEACLAGGARVLQLRDKDGDGAALLALVERLVAAARPFGGRIIVNDRADVARMAGAAGAHVGQEDLPVAAVLEILGPGGVCGISTHDRRQVDEALAGPATYIAAGPIFETGTKDTGYPARGLDLVRYAAGRGKPVVAIGGITLERAPQVIAAGASALAVITDLLASGDPEGRTRAFLASAAAEPFLV